MALAAAPVVRVEHLTDPGPALGLGTPCPRLSWVVPEADAGYRQSAYEVEVTLPAGMATYRVDADDQVLVPWPGEPLASREAARVRVRVTDGQDWSDWSDPSALEAGLLDPGDWVARFITPAQVGGAAPVIHGSFEVQGEVVRARLFATAHGVYVPTLNGSRVGDQVLAPGWTAYQHRIAYQTYDITDLVVEGRNSLDVLLGNGWYRGRVGFLGGSAHYGDRLALLAQIEIETADGGRQVFATGPGWTASESGILSDDLLNGQSTDLRVTSTPPGAVEVVAADLDVLCANAAPPVRVTDVLPCRSVTSSPSGATLVDFGQVIAGWVRIRVRGLAPGSTVTVRHAEVLEDGELSLGPLRSAKAIDTYLVAGGDEILEPSLTFHGFRYAQIDGIPDLRDDDIEAVVVGTDLLRIGWFDSSHELLNRFHENVVWSTRGNFLSVPTDCPQRDERLGWTGDIQIFAPTAMFLFDAAGFLESWLEDLAAEQNPDGSVPFTIPDILRAPASSAAAWGDAAVLVPWAVYERAGDIRVLERQLDSMRAWVDHVDSLAGPDHVWVGGYQFGDWLDPTAPEDDPNAAQTDPDLIATAYFARSAAVLARAARLVGEHGLADHYEVLAREVRETWQRTYVTPAGLVHSDSQTAYAIAIAWDLLATDGQRRTAGRRVADLVRVNAFRVGSGFVGTPLVPEALVIAGYHAVAHRLLLQTSCPSWLYPVTMGATTIWERWDSMLPDGSVNGNGMTSFNHYALGAVADWLHRSVAGLAPADPGYRRIEVRPRPPADLTWATARHLTPYGEAAVAWRRDEGRFTLAVDVPVGCTASVCLPGTTSPVEVGHGHHEWEAPYAVVASPTRSIRDVMDDPRTWRAVIDAAGEAGVKPGKDTQIAARLKAFLGAPVESLARAIVPPECFEPAFDLDARLASRLASVTNDQPMPSRAVGPALGGRTER